MNDKSAAAESHSLPAGEARHYRDLGREVSEVHGEVRVLKWACSLALVAILGGMGALYQHQQALGRNIQEVREDVGRIDERTIQLDKRLGTVEERIGTVEERLGTVEERLGAIEQLLRVLVARSASSS